MIENEINLIELIKSVENKEIVLPDFQREFVWKDEEQQRKIVASVLSKMPIGSILLLKSNPHDYRCKIIGCKRQIEASEMKDEVSFLLDGQQRMTVLANVFSNIIHDSCTKISDLSGPALKRRFFLRIPKWIDVFNGVESDEFGVKCFDFKFKDLSADKFDVLSGDLLKFIECISFCKDDKKPYNPQSKLSLELNDFCMTYDGGYLIPLYLMIPSGDEKKQSLIELKMSKIISDISQRLADEIQEYYVTLQNNDDKRQFVTEIFGDIFEDMDCNEWDGILEENLEDKKQLWIDRLKKYMDSCLEKVCLSKITVANEKRARAIDIYENLNRGGVSLNTFDLIIARVALSNNKGLFERLVESIICDKEYPENVVPDYIKKVFQNNINASFDMGCYNPEKREITQKYIDIYLDVLGIYCNNNNFDPENYRLDYVKKNNILNLKAEDINDYTEIVCRAIDRAMFFFQTRCGIRNIREINYSLIAVIVATVFIKDEWFENKSVHDLLEAWYWSSVFSGIYDKDQNSVFISHLKNVVSTLKKDGNKSWIKNIEKDVLGQRYFSDERFLLMEEAENERFPKAVLKFFICQYHLAKTYHDLFDNDKIISTFSEDADELEAHHIIPLGSVKKIDESTKSLRNKNDHICNSPLNFILITKKANKEISSQSPNDYFAKLNNQAKTELYLNTYVHPDEKDDEIKSMLRQRFTSLQGDIKNHIDKLL